MLESIDIMEQEKMIKMQSNIFYKFPMLLILFIGLYGCDDYQECIKSVEKNEMLWRGELKIDTIIHKYGDRGAYSVISKDRRDTLKIMGYNVFPRTPEIGDSIKKMSGEYTYTLYKSDSFFVIGIDCKIKRVIIYDKGVIEN